MFSLKVDFALEHYNMLEKEDKIVVAFSGGADSVALLHYLNKKGLRPSAIHVNHGIRGDEADGDEDFCRDFCEKNSIPFCAVHIDVPAEAKKRGEGLEETARKMRYAEIEMLMEKQGIAKAATAHHADDNIETVLFNISRGSGIKGAGGIPPVRDRYIRPLIECSRDEILAYCKENSLEYVTDSTNSDTDYTRNFIRHEIAPLLKRINPELCSAFTRFSSHARRDNELLDTMARDIPSDISRGELISLHPALLTRFIYLRCDELSYIPNSKSVDQLISALSMGNEYKRVDMGAGITAVCDRQRLYFIRDKKEDSLDPVILKKGKNSLGYYGNIYIAEDSEQWKAVCESVSITAHTKLSKDNISGEITARSRLDGDSYRCGGMTRSLKKLYNSKKLTVTQRNRLPVICDKEGIVWIPGFMPRDSVKINKNEENILYIGYSGEKNDIEQ
ncbi:MAG: tRNA lysidine(34) synthetase TilS [Ruminococcaceae bacterium]|nr:tRNA lysidine(34) synthetase TilS [Oscillospiraceae bacterium]